jgi:DNA-binding transcriptional regulator YhcF (GntR family)
MEFKEQKGIFQQIADRICDRILQGELMAGDKLDSVRELAAKIGVNQNTIMRTYSEMMRDGIISNQRGIGFFVAPEAKDIILAQRRNEFFNNDLPYIAHQARLLGISADEILKQLKMDN